MIQLLTNLKVADNSGAKIIECIQVRGGSRRRTGQIGDTIVAVVKEAEPRRIVKKHDIIKAVIVRQKKSFRRKNGSYIRFDENAAVILDGTTKDPKGGRIFGPIPRELKERGYDKIATMAKEIV